MKILLLCATLFALLTVSGATRAGAPAGLDVSRPEVREFIATMAQKHGFDPTSLASLLREAQTRPDIIELMQRPAERTLSWFEYRPRFLTEARIDGGVQVWQKHRADLERIAARTGVPAEYMVAITGVETSYGRVMGRHRVIDALVTLGFDYPPRQDFFRRELEQFLLLSREDNTDPLVPMGSYAGAMGVPQFMPSSVRAYAVDDGRDGRRQLFEFGPDVFASVANYFEQHGWQAGQPVISNALHDSAPDTAAGAKLALDDTIASLRARGYRFDIDLPASTPAMLVPAMLQQGMSWRVGYQNFYVITRYNRSFMYAMAVHELALAIAERYRATVPQVPQ